MFILPAAVGAGASADAEADGGPVTLARMFASATAELATVEAATTRLSSVLGPAGVAAVAAKEGEFTDLEASLQKLLSPYQEQRKGHEHRAKELKALIAAVTFVRDRPDEVFTIDDWLEAVFDLISEDMAETRAKLQRREAVEGAVGSDIEPGHFDKLEKRLHGDEQKQLPFVLRVIELLQQNGHLDFDEEDEKITHTGQ